MWAMGGKLRLAAEFPNRQPVAVALADITGEPKARLRHRRPKMPLEVPGV
jgi:hypothetical protein